MITVVKQVSASKSCFYNDRVSYREADKTLTDGRFSYFKYYNSSFDHRIKKSRSAEKNKNKNIIGQKSGPAKTIFSQESGLAMAGSAVPPTTALLRWRL